MGVAKAMNVAVFSLGCTPVKKKLQLKIALDNMKMFP
jgi:hypothetical protein